jgi:DNA invertase Pin-like site-specific DNA recombinase
MLQPTYRKSPRSTNERALTQERRAARIARYEEIKRMRVAGVSISAIARYFGMQRSTVSTLAHATHESPKAG